MQKKDYIIILLFKIIIIYIVFDGLRDNLIISSYITYFKEIVTFVLFFYIVFIKHVIFIQRNFIYYIFLLFSLYYISFLPFSFLSFFSHERVVSSSLIMYYKIYQFIMLAYIFSVYETVTKDKYENLLRFFIKLLVLFVIITPIIYFIKPFFMVEHFEQWGRINIGYPTMDAENLVFGIVLYLFIFRDSFFKVLIALILFFIGIFMQMTATGFATLLFVLGYYLVYRNKKKINKRVIVFLGIIVFIILSYIIAQYGDLLENQLYLMNMKINAILDPSTSKGLSLRVEEFHSQIIYLNDWFTNIFGIGFQIYLENQYDWFRIGTGLIGLYGYIFFLFSLIIYGWLVRKKDNSILFISSVVFALTSYSLITLYLFPTEASFAMMIGYSIHLQRRYKIAKISNRLQNA